MKYYLESVNIKKSTQNFLLVFILLSGGVIPTSRDDTTLIKLIIVLETFRPDTFVDVHFLCSPKLYHKHSRILLRLSYNSHMSMYNSIVLIRVNPNPNPNPSPNHKPNPDPFTAPS